MSTPTTVLKQLNELIEQINASTGLADTTLTEAVRSLTTAHAALDENASTQAAELSALQKEHTSLSAAHTALEQEHAELTEECASVTSMLGTLIDRSVTTLTSANASKIADYALYGCTTLTHASFPAATSVGTYGFNRCTTMEDVQLPLVKSIGSYAFRQCYMLTTIDLPAVTSISSYAFESNVRLTALILRSPTLCTLAATNAFNSCYHILGSVSASFNPDGLKDGYIYVPRALVSAYEAATNWSSFAGQFRAIEDYPDICGS